MLQNNPLSFFLSFNNLQFRIFPLFYLYRPYTIALLNSNIIQL